MVTVPTDALSVTGSESGSLKVPVIEAGSPLFTSTETASALTYGFSLPLGSTTSNSESMPFVEWKKMWQWNIHRPRPPPSVVPSIRGRSSRRTLKRRVYPGVTSTLSLNS